MVKVCGIRLRFATKSRSVRARDDPGFRPFYRPHWVQPVGGGRGGQDFLTNGVIVGSGCPVGQGHYFARPMPGVQVGELFAPQNVAGRRQRMAPSAKPSSRREQRARQRPTFSDFGPGHADIAQSSRPTVWVRVIAHYPGVGTRVAWDAYPICTNTGTDRVLWTDGARGGWARVPLLSQTRRLHHEAKRQDQEQGDYRRHRGYEGERFECSLSGNS